MMSALRFVSLTSLALLVMHSAVACKHERGSSEHDTATAQAAPPVADGVAEPKRAPMPGGWVRYFGDGFEVALPVLPETTPARWVAPSGEASDGVMSIAVDPAHPTQSYGVSLNGGLSAETTRENRSLLEAAKQKLVSQFHGVIVSERMVDEQHGFAGDAVVKELVINGDGPDGPGWTYVLRLIVSPDSFVQLIATFPSTDMLDPTTMERVDAFLASFVAK